MQVGWRFEQSAHGEIEIARLQESEQLGVEAHVKLDLRGRALDDEARQQRLADESRHDVSGADAHLADLAGRELGDLALRIVQRDAGHVGSRAQRSPDRRQFDAARRAHEQLRAQVGLEPLQAARQRRLADAQRVGGARQVARFADGEEVLEFPVQQRHAQKLSHMCVFGIGTQCLCMHNRRFRGQGRARNRRIIHAAESAGVVDSAHTVHRSCARRIRVAAASYREPAGSETACDCEAPMRWPGR